MKAVSAPLPVRLNALRAAQRRSRYQIIAGLLALIIAGVALTLMRGQSFTPPMTVLRVLLGDDIAGASFAIRELRLPRAVMAVLTGLCFGLGGAAFQTLLRNPLASPDIIGISAGASAAATIAIIFFGLGGAAVSLIAVIAALGVAALIAVLAGRGAAAGTRLVLIGIGLSAMAQSLTAWALTQAPSWSRAEALRWLSGSLNGATLEAALPLLAALVICGAVLISRSPALEAMRMGEDMAAGLGVSPARTRLIVALAAVGVIAFATAAAGPIAFVAFLAGPIAAQLSKRGGPILIPAALVGAALVLLADFTGQFLLPARLPVGIVTGALGAPYLIYLLIRINRQGGAL